MTTTRFANPRPARWVGFFLLILAAGCGNDRACSIDGDCFQGEFCIDGGCADEPSSSNNRNNTTNNASTNGSTNNTATNNSSTNNDTSGTNNATTGTTGSNNGTTTTNNGTAGSNNQTSETNNMTAACIVDLFGNQCAEDEWEDNDGYEPAGTYGDQTPWESDSWCDGATLNPSQRTLSGTLCAGDLVDAFRLVVANNGPMCISGNNTTFRITIDIKTPCPAEFLKVEPYTFGLDPVRNDLCADNAMVQCRSEDGGQRRIVEWIWGAEQIYDPRVQIVTDQTDVQIEYDLTFEIIPQ